jgi:hypothetical protein
MNDGPLQSGSRFRDVETCQRPRLGCLHAKDYHPERPFEGATMRPEHYHYRDPVCGLVVGCCGGAVV